MNSSKILAAALPIFLSGCLDISDTNTDYQPINNAQVQKPLSQQQSPNVAQRPMNRRFQNIYQVNARPQPQPQPQTPTASQQMVTRDVYQVSTMPQSRMPRVTSQETSRSQLNAAEEARQLEQAQQASLRTYEAEQARRQQEVAAAVSVPKLEEKPVFAQDVVPQSNQAPQAQVAEWQPLDGHLVRAGDLVMELKKSKGGQYPSREEMSAYIQAKMGLSAQQAGVVLEELGV